MQSHSTEDIQKILAANVRHLRENTGWTQECAAEAIGIAARHYQKLEAGQVNVTIATLGRVAKAFGVSVNQLFVEGHE